MGLEIKNKLNHLLSIWPDRTLMTSRFLSHLNYSYQLIQKYAKSGWIRKVGQGAYTKLNDVIQWPGGVAALQQQLNLPVHVGGITALELHGLAHFLSMENLTKSSTNLYNTTFSKKPLPKWFLEFFPNCIYRQHHLFQNEMGLEEKQVDGITITISSPERAILEVLTLIPYDFDYAHAYQLCENLQLLRPNLMQQLLQQCTSVKVKRLFLYFADTHQLPLFSHLEFQSIALGKGKRTIGKGGHFIAKYQIAVPMMEIGEVGIEDDV